MNGLVFLHGIFYCAHMYDHVGAVTQSGHIDFNMMFFLSDSGHHFFMMQSLCLELKWYLSCFQLLYFLSLPVGLFYSILSCFCVWIVMSVCSSGVARVPEWGRAPAPSPNSKKSQHAK